MRNKKITMKFFLIKWPILAITLKYTQFQISQVLDERLVMEFFYVFKCLCLFAVKDSLKELSSNFTRPVLNRLHDFGGYTGPVESSSNAGTSTSIVIAIAIAI